jgi:hypothetical protein
MNTAAKLLKLDPYKTIVVYTLQPLYPVISVTGIFSLLMVACLVQSSFSFLFGHVNRHGIPVTGV